MIRAPGRSIAVAVVLPALACPAASAELTFRLLDLGALEAGGTSKAFGVSNKGEIVGEASVVEGEESESHGFVLLFAAN